MAPNPFLEFLLKNPTTTPEVLRSFYREKIKSSHPDGILGGTGIEGSVHDFDLFRKQYEQALVQLQAKKTHPSKKENRVIWQEALASYLSRGYPSSRPEIKGSSLYLKNLYQIKMGIQSHPRIPNPDPIIEAFDRFDAHFQRHPNKNDPLSPWWDLAGKFLYGWVDFYRTPNKFTWRKAVSYYRDLREAPKDGNFGSCQEFLDFLMDWLRETWDYQN